MKLIYKSVILFTTALVGLSSCDPLGVELTNQLSEEKFWNDPQLTRTYINNFYSWFPAATNERHQSEQWSDNCIATDEKDNNVFNQKTFYQRNYNDLTVASCFTAPWTDSYKQIRAVNIGIERISASTKLLEVTQKQYLAECYFFRAWLYFDLEKYWGSVPYVDKVLTLEDNTMIPRSSREMIFDKILADLDLSAQLFKASGLKPQLGLVNIDAVNTFKSRVALYAACAADASNSGIYDKLSGSSETKQLFKFTKDATSYYKIAKAAAAEVKGKYSLEPNYKDLFNTPNGHKSQETIWPIMFDENNRKGFNPGGANGVYGNYYGLDSLETQLSWPETRGAAFPTQDLVDCYYQKDNADGKWKQWWKTKQATIDMGGTVDQAGNYSAQTANYHIMYENRDERFYATCLYDSAFYAGNNKPMYMIGVWIDNTNPETSQKYSALHTGFRLTNYMGAPSGKGSDATITGYYPCKYVQSFYNNDGSINNKQPSVSMIVFRYAEVLLNYAEACIKLNEDIAEATNCINEIRDRAGLDKFDPAIVNHDLWEEYTLQRRIEFALEIPGQRYFDLLRWNEAKGNTTITELNRGPKATQIFRKGVESSKLGTGLSGYPVKPGEPGYFTPIIKTTRFDYDAFNKKFDNGKYYFIPFQQTLLQSYTGFHQNPGW